MPKMGHLVPYPGTEMYDYVKEECRPIMELEQLHRSISSGRGAKNTKRFGVSFETDEYSLEKRWKMLGFISERI